MYAIFESSLGGAPPDNPPHLPDHYGNLNKYIK